MARTSKRNVFYINNQNMDTPNMIKLKINLFPSNKRKESFAYSYLTYNYVDRNFNLNLSYFRIDDEQENILEPSDFHQIDLNKKNLIALFTKLGIETINQKHHEEFISFANSILYDIIFIADDKDEESITKAYSFFQKMKSTYAEILEHFNNQNQIKSIELARSRLISNVSDDNKHNFYIRVYNAGQANCSALFKKDKEEPIIVFDLGLEAKTTNPSQKQMIDSMDGNGIVLISHFHYDHYNLYKSLSPNAMKSIFIVHEFPKVLQGYTAGFTNKLYQNKSSVIQIKDDTILKPEDYIDLGILKIAQGLSSKKSKNQNSKENNHSLVSFIKINDNEVILPGDALENEFAIEDNKEFRLGFISHHGCYIDFDIPYYVYDAFLPVNTKYHKKYHHPQEKHITKYNKVIRFGKNTSKIYNASRLKKDTITYKIDNDFIDWFL